jgi:UDP-N-acetylglucosamine acyltransferase
MTTIDPTARVETGAVIGQNVSIGSYCTIGAQVRIGDDCTLHGHVNIAGQTEIGARTAIFPFTSLGTVPQSVHYKGEPTRLVIGSDCTIREHVTMNIGTAGGSGVTTVGSHCFFMAGSHVGHDSIVGAHVVFANNATLGGFCEIGDNAFLGGLCAVHQFTRVGEHAMIGGLVGVTVDVIPFAMVIGHRATLAGINRIGLRRRGLSPEQIRTVYRGYRALFYGPGTLASRTELAAQTFADSPHVMRMVEFIRTAKSRRIAVPRAGKSEDDEGR